MSDLTPAKPSPPETSSTESANIIWMLSVVASTLGLLATLGFLLAMTERMGPLGPALLIFAFVLGPFAAMALLAWIIRTHAVKSIVLLVLIVACGGFATWFYAGQYAEFLHRDPNMPDGSNWAPFLLALAQWLLVFFLCVILLPWFLLEERARRSKHSSLP